MERINELPIEGTTLPITKPYEIAEALEAAGEWRVTT
jgi:hypothetical protein